MLATVSYGFRVVPTAAEDSRRSQRFSSETRPSYLRFNRESYQRYNERTNTGSLKISILLFSSFFCNRVTIKCIP